MKKTLTTIILILTVVATATAYERINGKIPERGKYKVVRIYDGDTFTILLTGTNYTVNIRINGIDAPERTQEFGLYARLYLERIIANEPVTIIPLEIDKWGRVVATCYNSQGQDIALEMLRAGMAWHYSDYDNTKKYIDAERDARYSQEGLWARPNPINPQAYRNAPRSIRRKYQ